MKDEITDILNITYDLDQFQVFYDHFQQKLSMLTDTVQQCQFSTSKYAMQNVNVIENENEILYEFNLLI